MSDTYLVSGMTCEGCVRAVTNAIQRAVPGAAVDVDLETGILRDRDLAGRVGVVARLQPRVLGERRPRFLRLRNRGMVGEGDDGEGQRTEDVADLVELARIRGGDQ
ncbi:MAG: heavy-metal-associated domain-containing protein [Proteobacteria bacterium]|nr:heavy-metal-associated domain-containing protein [Pseudomonadota bacterium]